MLEQAVPMRDEPAIFLLKDVVSFQITVVDVGLAIFMEM